MRPRIQIGPVAFDDVTEAEVCQLIDEALSRGRGGFVVTVNVDHMVRCERSPQYLELVKKADLVVADGAPLIWASRIQRTPLPERVAGSTLCLSLAATLAQSKKSIFLLGGNAGVADEAARILCERFPGLKIAGTHYPPFGFEKDAEHMNLVRGKLQASGADVVYVALGSPKQEELIHRLHAELPSAWWLGVGISLSFITGEVRRAPKWVQQIGLEWCHRLIQEPKRLFRRYIIDGLPYAARLLVRSWWNRR